MLRDSGGLDAKGFRFRHTWTDFMRCTPANAKAQPIAPPPTQPRFS